MAIKTVDNICEDIKQLSHSQYLKGLGDVIDILNSKYLIKVWHKEDSEKFFDDFMETLRDLNLQYNKLNREHD